MAEVIGFLREDATSGEKGTLGLLRQNLPKEYSVYVETPIHKDREIRYPDFIVLTNYGIIVLEVKDWVQVEGRATPHGISIRTRDGKIRTEGNPVNTAREYAIALSAQLNNKMNQRQPGEAIPWSFAVVLYNLPTSVITQLRTPWGENFVLGKPDLENPDILLDRIKKTFPVFRMRPLTKEELDRVRATIYPVVEIEVPGRAPVILDQQQEKIVTEAVRQVAESPSLKEIKKDQEKLQDHLFAEPTESPASHELPVKGEKIIKDVSIRLVRGFSGSGKTLVLMQRAKFLAAQYPEWKVIVLTFNKLLQEQLEGSFIGTAVQAKTLHGLCQQLLHLQEKNRAELKDWLGSKQKDHPIISEIGKGVVAQEINYLRDLGIMELSDYLTLERKGMGQKGRLDKEKREQVFDVLKEYQSHLSQNKKWDYSEMPSMAMKMLESATNPALSFDAILIDEAQDWAPQWFKVVNKLLNQEHGLLFLADDPSQSIYRNFSWREKSVEVVGRTRWLRVPYRNTFEIYRAAYALIANNAEIQESLKEEGELIKPDFTSQEMRHDKRPLIHKLSNTRDELFRIKVLVDLLKTDGYREEQIAVLTRFKNDLEPIKTILKGYNVIVHQIHSFKGLEMEAVILPHIHRTFANSEEETSERRLMYMAMTRARSRLYLTHSGKLPEPFEDLRSQNLADFLG